MPAYLSVVFFNLLSRDVSLSVQAPEFRLSFLLPKYWLTWLAVIVLYTISWLPYRVQTWIGEGFGRLVFLLAKKRVKVAERNFELCFPELTDAERDRLLKKHRTSVGMAILETGMGWWWPNWRIKKHSEVVGYEHVEAILKKGKGVFGLAIHNMNLEFCCVAVGLLKSPAVAFYRKHNNALMDFIQYRGRNRSNKYMVHKRDVGGLIGALNDGEVTYYLPDQDYGLNRAEFVPFFGVEQTATTKGPLLFASEANCESVFIYSIREGSKYKVVFLPGLDNFPSGDAKYDLQRMNAQIEQMIRVAPEQYLWMHKRFKTRPNQADKSLYD